MLVAVVVGILTIGIGGITVSQGRRSNPQRRLSYEVETVPLLPIETNGSAIEVSVKGGRVNEPHVTLVRVVSDSRADIDSSKFDAQLPIAFNLGVPILHVSESGAKGISLSANGSQILLPPQLIKPDSSGFISVVTEGQPDGRSPINTLIDIDVRERPAIRDVFSGMGRVLVLLGVLLTYFAVLAAIIMTQLINMLDDWVAVLVTGLLSAVVATSSIVISVRVQKWWSRRRS